MEVEQARNSGTPSLIIETRTESNDSDALQKSIEQPPSTSAKGYFIH